MTKYVTVGAGIIGLYTTFLLLENGVNPEDVTIIAEFLPGDQSINYASPYAGAYFSACIDEDDLKFSKFTYEKLHILQNKLGEKSGISCLLSTEYLDNIPSDQYLSKLKDFLHDFEIVEPIGNCRIGIRYKAWVFNSPLLIENLINYLIDKGVNIKRIKLMRIHEAFSDSTEMVFNCTGNGSIDLGGVEDSNVYPTRGQIIVIRGPHINECISKWSKDSTYIIKRPHSNNDEVILGGFYQPGNFDGNTYGYETQDILKRTIELYPKILEANPNGNSIKDLQILRTVAGARPSRKGGVRIEREKLEEERYVVHNYGAGGCGYLCGLGMANEAIKLALN